MDTHFPITITKDAADAVLDIMLKEGLNTEEKWLYVGIKGGGCSGFTYVLDFNDGPQDEEWWTSEQFGIKVCIDPISSQHIAGTEIDYHDSLNGAGFKFNNPNATRKCGCGESFG